YPYRPSSKRPPALDRRDKETILAVLSRSGTPSPEVPFGSLATVPRTPWAHGRKGGAGHSIEPPYRVGFPTASLAPGNQEAARKRRGQIAWDARVVMTASRTDDLASAERRNQELTKELWEAREQQAATGGILRAISNSPTDLQGIFQEIATTAARLCDAYDAGVLQCAGDHLKLVAHHGLIPVGGPLPLTRGLVMGRAVLDRTILQVADAQAETEEYPAGSEKARRDGARTILAVPLICA